MTAAAASSAGASALSRSGNEAPFGAYAPTLLQRVLIDLAQYTPLGRGSLRWGIAALLEKLRSGPIDVTRLGLKMRLHYYGGHYSEKKMLLKIDQYDREEIEHLTRDMEPDFHFVDIGAHTGMYAFAVKAKRPDAKVIAFEPNLRYAERLRFNIEANGFRDFALIPAAAGAERGTLPFYTEHDALNGQGPAIQVPVVNLYDTLTEHGFSRVDGLKIDIEGYEDRVLFPYFASAPQPMWPRVLLMEYCQGNLWERDCLALCESLGYRRIFSSELNTVLVRDTSA